MRARRGDAPRLHREGPRPWGAWPWKGRGGHAGGAASPLRTVRVAPPPELLHLERLGRVLAERGRPSRLSASPPLLRVPVPGVPCVGESIRVVPVARAGRWFRSSAGLLLAPCHDVDTAAREIARLLAPWTPPGKQVPR